jgi:hypothetical protein
VVAVSTEVSDLSEYLIPIGSGLTPTGAATGLTRPRALRLAARLRDLDRARVDATEASREYLLRSRS